MLVGVAFLPPSFPPSRTQAFYIIKRQNCLNIYNTVYITMATLVHASVFFILPFYIHTSNLRTCNDAELHVAFLGTPEGLQTQQGQCLKMIKYLKSNEKGKFRQNFLQGQISLSHYNPTPLHFTYELVMILSCISDTDYRHLMKA